MEDLEAMLEPTLESKSLAQPPGRDATKHSSMARKPKSGRRSHHQQVRRERCACWDDCRLVSCGRGPTLDVLSLQVKMPEGSCKRKAKISLSSYVPRFDFKGSVNDFPWRGGLVDAEGTFQTKGTGEERLRNLAGDG